MISRNNKNIFQVVASGNVAEFLRMRNQFDKAAVDDSGHNLLWHAIQSGNKEMEMLVRKHCGTGAASGKGAAPAPQASAKVLSLHKAIKAGDINMILRMLGKGADVHETDADGHNALWHAQASGNKEIIGIISKYCGQDAKQRQVNIPTSTPSPSKQIQSQDREKHTKRRGKALVVSLAVLLLFCIGSLALLCYIGSILPQSDAPKTPAASKASAAPQAPAAPRAPAAQPASGSNKPAGGASPANPGKAPGNGDGSPSGNNSSKAPTQPASKTDSKGKSKEIEKIYVDIFEFNCFAYVPAYGNCHDANLSQGLLRKLPAYDISECWS